jgi:hypothetical protein
LSNDKFYTETLKLFLKMMDANEFNRLPSEEAPAVAEAETEVTPSATEGVEIT